MTYEAMWPCSAVVAADNEYGARFCSGGILFATNFIKKYSGPTEDLVVRSTVCNSFC
jgi:hypothetical protein